MKRISKPEERGSALVEFMLCFALFWMPLFFGTLQMGFSLIRAIQVTQVCRDAAHMYAFGTDFSQTGAQTLLSNLAPGLGLTSSGNGVVILSAITYVDDCRKGGYGSVSGCANYQKAVFMNRTIVGNSSVHASAFGTPTANGTIAPSTYISDPNAVAVGFLNLIPLQSSSQVSYVAEMAVNSTDFNWWSALSSPTIAARSIF